MGERAAYTVKDSTGDSSESCDIWIRKQWYVGCSKQDIRGLFENLAKFLSKSSIEDEAVINGGGHALRQDLGGGRMAHALIQVIGTRPFDSVSSEKPYDISNNGVFEIELMSWNHWVLNHIPVSWGSEEGEKLEIQQKEKVAEVSFEEGEPLSEGIDFNWLLDEDSVSDFRWYQREEG